MSQLEHLITLLSIILGLGLTDLAQSLRNLVRPVPPVRWHWLPLLWVVFALLLVINIWWGAYDLLQADIWANPVAFLLVVLMGLCLYLVCAFALPDVQWESPAAEPSSTGSAGLDLEAFYFSDGHRRWFFGTLIVLFVIAFVGNIVGASLKETAIVQNALLNLAVVGVYGLLIVTQRKAVHVVVALASLAMMLVTLLNVGPGLG
jgi:peptidoglycan/LPS O-acetylase OafA/YrhL